MIELQAEQRVAIEQPQPGLSVVNAVIQLCALLLGHQGAQAAGHGNHDQQANGQAQVGDPGDQAFHQQVRGWLSPSGPEG